ncbi:MAG: peroxiredoxin [Chromatocurvus sp.]
MEIATALRMIARRVSAMAFLLLCTALPTTAIALEVGDEAPDFELPGTDGKRYRLSDFEGKTNVVLAWFPQAFTSGCTIECKSLARNGDRLRQYDVRYFMISVDPIDDNRRFADSLQADFPLLSDASKEVAAAYNVLYENRFALRHTMYIDTAGVITAIDSNVDPQTSAEDMLRMLEELGVPRRAATGSE